MRLTMPYTGHPNHKRSVFSNLDDDAIFMIGLIVRWWAMVEFTVESSIYDLLNRPDTSAIDAASARHFKQRLALLRSLCAEVVRDPMTMNAIDSAIRRVGRHQSLRNLLTHGFVVPDSKRPTTHLYVSRLRWSQPIKRDWKFISRKALYQYEPELARAATKLFMLTAGCHDPDAWPASIDQSPILTAAL